MLVLSASSKENVIKMLNNHFYSTTYSINENNEITWKNGEVKLDLRLVIKKNRFQVHQITN
jgi:hypothetical protein